MADTPRFERSAAPLVKDATGGATTKIYVMLTDTTLHAPLTGLSPAATEIKISKNGAADANFGGTFTEISAANYPGLYSYQYTAGELSAAGEIMAKFAIATSDTVYVSSPVVVFDVFSAGPNVNISTATGTLTELVAVPAASPTIAQGLALLYMALRNSSTATATARTVKNDAGTTIGTATMSDNGTTFTQGKLA